jgi:hypothetical protein
MPRTRLWLPLLPLLLTACGTTAVVPETKVERITVPDPLLVPVDRPTIPAAPTQRDVGELLLRYDGALDTCNGRLDAIRALQAEPIDRKE